MHFFKLPAELRNYIYELTLPEHQIFTNLIVKDRKQRWEFYSLPGLLQASKQIRAETEPVFWNLRNYFTIKSGYNHTSKLPSWIRHLSKSQTKRMYCCQHRRSAIPHWVWLLLRNEPDQDQLRLNKGTYNTDERAIVDTAHAHGTPSRGCNRSGVATEAHARGEELCLAVEAALGIERRS